MHKKRYCPFRNNIYFFTYAVSDYSATVQVVESAQSPQPAAEQHPADWSVHPPQHPAAAGASSAAFSELLQHAHEAAPNIAAASAMIINVFFIVFYC